VRRIIRVLGIKETKRKLCGNAPKTSTVRGGKDIEIDTRDSCNSEQSTLGERIGRLIRN